MKRKTFLFISAGVVAVVAAALTVVFVFAFNKKGEDAPSGGGIPSHELVEFNPNYLTESSHLYEFTFAASKPTTVGLDNVVIFNTDSQNASIGSYQLHDYLYAAMDNVIFTIAKDSNYPINYSIELQVITCDSNGENKVTHPNSEFTITGDPQSGYNTTLSGNGWIYIHTVTVNFIYL